MPMAGDEIELHLPDERVVMAQIASFGISVWQDGEGTFFTNMDPADPSLTLTIKGADLVVVPPGTTIWLPDAKFASA